MIPVALPYLCLRKIFDFISLNDLINCYEAFDEWKPIISQRLARVKYLLPEGGFYGVHANAFVDNQLETVSCNGQNFANILNHCKANEDFLPNLKVFLISKEMAESRRNIKIIKRLIENKQSFKGLVFSGLDADLITAPNNYIRIPNIEYLAIDHRLGRFEFPVHYDIANQIKQIYHSKYFCTFECFNHAPNVIRLHASTHENRSYRPREYPGGYYKPVLINGRHLVLPKLEILELGTYYSYWHQRFMFIYSYGFYFLTLCPALKSIYLELGNRFEAADYLRQNLNMRDLVLSYRKEPPMYFSEGEFFDHDWFFLRTVLKNFPNLKHLAIRYNCQLRDGDIRELVGMLPKLVLLDLRGSTGITQRSVDYVADYCIRKNRNIKIYIDSNADEIKLDWPNLSTDYKRICKGVDFMKHCFLKPFEYLPYFMVPDDPDW